MAKKQKMKTTNAPKGFSRRNVLAGAGAPMGWELGERLFEFTL